MDRRICELTEKILNNSNEKKMNTALLIKGYRYFSEAQEMLKQGLKEKNMDTIKEGLKLLTHARVTIDEALVNIVDKEEVI